MGGWAEDDELWLARMSWKRLRPVADHLLAPHSAGAAAEPVPDEEATAIVRYIAEGAARARSLGNRGPVRFGRDGKIAREILDSYYEHGFYVLEGVIGQRELEEVREEFETLLDNAPSGGPRPWKSSVDQSGHPVRHPEAYGFAKPLSDPLGESAFGVYDFTKGEAGKPRNQMKMREPSPGEGAPAAVVQNIGHPLLYLDGALRLYGHPQLLAVAEAINGPDFTPFTESLFYKPAGFGTSTAWHQDPSSAWDQDWKAGRLPVGHCGTSFHASIYSCTPENALWLLPGSHLHGRADIKALSKACGGSDR